MPKEPKGKEKKTFPCPCKCGRTIVVYVEGGELKYDLVEKPEPKDPIAAMLEGDDEDE